jgi:DHA2 family multidrug resistance protein
MPHTDASAAETPAWTPRANPWWIAVAVMLPALIEVLDSSIANVALPQMAGSMASSLDEATWVLTSYMVANAIVLPMTGWLSSFFGRKRFLILCTLTFTLSSAACGMANHMGLMILSRIVQGAAGGALLPITQAILMESFPPAKRGMAMAVYGMGVVVAPIFGPVLGGWLTDNYSWRWIFYVNLPFGLLGILLLHIFVEDPPYLRNAKEKLGGAIDCIGFASMALALGLFQVVLDRGQTDDWFNAAWICWGMGISAVALAFFVFWEFRTPRPLVDLHVFQDRNFTIGTCLLVIGGVMIYSTTSLLPMFLQGLLGYPSLNSGLAMSLRGVGAIFAMFLVGPLANKIDARIFVSSGFALVAYSAFQFGNLTLEIAPHNLDVPNILMGLGMGCLMVPLMTVSLTNISNERMGNASGVSNLARTMGGSMGISLTTALVTRYTQVHQALLVGNVSPYNPTYQRHFQSLAASLNQYSDSVTAQGRALGMMYGAVQQQSVLYAYVDVFRLLAMICVCCIPIAFLLKKTRAGGGSIAMH